MDAKSHNWKKVKKRKRDSSTSNQVDQQVQILFEKIYTFHREEEWTLPNSEVIFGTSNSSSMSPDSGKVVQKLQELKGELNDVKGQLSDMDISKWHKHTSSTHRGNNILFPSWKNHQRFELKTQAWFKFYELLLHFPLVPNLGTFSSVHLCEAPGAFIASLNHFLKQNKQFKNHHWKWLANTLNLYYEGNMSHETITDDRLIQHTTDSWYFGVDNTGDIMRAENLRGLMQRIADEVGQVQLVTADGSFNCQDNPAEQENLVHPLHFSETIAAISVLSKGGSFVLKMFTLFELNTACLMYLLCGIFDEVHVKKPVTSKAGNSEVYIVCLGFQGICSNLLEKLLQYYGHDPAGLVMFPPSSLPVSFWNQLLDCACQFKEYQVDTIKENMTLFENNNDDEKWAEIREVQKGCAERFFQRCRPIRMDQWICKDGTFKKTLNLSHGKLQGSWNERQLDKHLSQEEYLKKMTERLEICKWEKYKLCVTVKVARASWKQDIKSCDFVEGKPLKAIKLSMFCSGDVLESWNTICERSKVFKNMQKSSFPVNEEFSGKELGIKEISHWPFHSMNIRLKSTDISSNQEEVNPIKITDISTLLVDEDFTNKLIAEYSHKAEYIIADCCCMTDAFSSSSSWELQSRHLLLAVVYLSINLSCDGANLTLLLPGLLTRYSAGLIYLLETCFQEVTLQHSCNSVSYIGPVKVECKVYSSSSQLNASSVLKTLYQKCVNTSPSDKFEILETVPVAHLLDPEFQTSLMQFNNSILKAKACSLIMAEFGMNTEEK